MTLTEVLEIQPADKEVAEQARARHGQLTKPPGSLGRLESLGVRLAAIYGTLKPLVKGKGVAVFAADHGVTAAGVSAYPKEVTAQMVTNFLHGGAAINALASVASASLLVVDVGVATALEPHAALLARKVALGTKNMADEPAMTSAEVQKACEVGIEVANRLIEAGATLLAGGEMGIGNTTAAAALTAVFTKSSVQEVTGRGTGVDDERFAHKVRVIEEALDKHQPDSSKPLEVLAKVGGLEIAALTGFYLASAAHRIPVVLDGFYRHLRRARCGCAQPERQGLPLRFALVARAGASQAIRAFGFGTSLQVRYAFGGGVGRGASLWDFGRCRRCFVQHGDVCGGRSIRFIRGFAGSLEKRHQFP